MKTINYDFSNLELAVSRLKENQSMSVLNDIKKELNKFFNDSRCEEIIFTNNTDKLFFGMCVIPKLDYTLVNKICSEEEVKHRINSYYLEIDSKLLNLNLSKRELVAILLHEVGHIVNTTEPLAKVQDGLNVYFSERNDNLDYESIAKTADIFRYAIQDAVRNLTSLFKKPDEEILADEFSVRCGYGKDLESAYKKIVNQVKLLNKGVPNKFVTLQWSLRIYKELGIQRIYAIRTLDKAISITGSELEKRRMTDLKKKINTIQLECVVQESLNIMRNANKYYKKIKYNSIRSLEDDLYEFNLKVKNVDEHDDALTILRQINSRLSIIDDYISTEKLTEKELERWTDLMDKYRMVREELSKKSTYDEKFYGLFVQMPNIKSRYEM